MYRHHDFSNLLILHAESPTFTALYRLHRLQRYSSFVLNKPSIKLASRWIASAAALANTYVPTSPNRKQPLFPPLNNFLRVKGEQFIYKTPIVKFGPAGFCPPYNVPCGNPLVRESNEPGLGYSFVKEKILKIGNCKP